MGHDKDDVMVFAGSGSRRLTRQICDYLNVEICKNETIRFSEGNIFVRILENVRGRSVYIVQSIVYHPNAYFMELLFWIDAFKRASAASVTVVIPFFSYGKGDKKDEPRVSIRARVCADAIEAAGADRVITMDLHAAQIQGFFRIPVDNLYGHPTLSETIKHEQIDDLVVISPDTGFADNARRFANYLETSVAIGDKQRSRHDENAEILHVIGDVAGKNAVIVDDFIISGGTLADLARKLLDFGVKDIYAAVSHGVFTGRSVENIEKSPIKKVFVTNTVEGHEEHLGSGLRVSEKIQFVDVAPLFGEAIKRIHYRESISAMFPT